MVVAFIVLGALSLGAGYMGGRYLLRGVAGDSPTVTAPPQQVDEENGEVTPPDGTPGDTDNGSEDDETSETDPPSENGSPGMESMTLSGGAITLYRVQAGVFGVEDYAELMRDELREEGIPAIILPTSDGRHRVLVDVLGTESAARQLMNQLEERGYESIFSTWSLPGLERRIEASPDDHEALQQLFDLLADVIRIQSEMEPWGDVSQAVLRGRIDEFGALRENLRGNLPASVERFLDIHADVHLMELRTALPREARESFMNFTWAMAEFRRE